MENGYNGKILYVNLTKKTHEVKEPDELWYRTYFGGTGIIAQTLLSEIGPDIDPLGPENVLVFACSVVTGAPLSGFNRYSVGAKSPLTGGFARTEAAGYFGPELKFAGFDIREKGSPFVALDINLNADLVKILLNYLGHLFALFILGSLE